MRKSQIFQIRAFYTELCHHQQPIFSAIDFHRINSKISQKKCVFAAKPVVYLSNQTLIPSEFRCFNVAMKVVLFQEKPCKCVQKFYKMCKNYTKDSVKSNSLPPKFALQVRTSTDPFQCSYSSTSCACPSSGDGSNFCRKTGTEKSEF